MDGADRDRLLLDLVPVQFGIRRLPVPHAAQPAGQADRIHCAAVEPDSADRIVDMRRIAGQKGASAAISRRNALADAVEALVEQRVSVAARRDVVQS